MRTPQRLLAAVAVLLTATLSSFAAVKTWDGGGADNNFLTPANWNADTLPTFGAGAGGTADELYFAGTVRLQPFNNTNAAQLALGIIFPPGAGAFTIGGSNIALGTTTPSGTGISNLSANVQTFNCLVAPRLGRILAQSNDLVFNGDFLVGNGGSGRSIVFDGAGNIYMNGRMSSAGTPSKTGSGILFLTNALNDFTGPFNIQNGVVRIAANNSLGAVTSVTTVDGNSGNSGRLEVSNNITVGNAFTINARQAGTANAPHIVNIHGTNTFTNNFNLSTGGSEYNFQSDVGQVNFLGNMTTPTTGFRTLKLMGAAVGRIAGNIVGPNPGTGNLGALVKQGAGRWTLEGTNITFGAISNTQGRLVFGPLVNFTNNTAFQVDASVLDVSAVSGGFALRTNQTLGGTGSVIGDVTANGATVVPGAALTFGTLSLSNHLTLNSGSKVSFDIGPTTSVGGTANDLLLVQSNLTLSGTVTFAIAFPAGVPATAGYYTLVRYGGTLSGSAANVTVTSGNPRFSYAVNTDTAGEIRLTVTGNPASLEWDGFDSASVWQVGLNGWNKDFSTPDVFYQGDNVIFDDWSLYPDVYLSGTLMPSSVLVDASINNYSFNSNGTLAGAMTLTKSGTGSLVISNANSYTGATLINGGSVRIGTGTALGTADSGTVIGNGATLDLNGQNVGAEAFTISGAGTNGAGAIINGGADQQNATRFVTLSNNATVGGSGRWDIRGAGGAGTFSGSVNLSGFTMTKVGSNKVSMVDSTVTNTGSLQVQQGTLAATRSLLDGPGNISINGGLFELENYTTGYVAKPILMNGGGLRSTGNTVNVDSPMTLATVAPVETAVGMTLRGAVTGTGPLVKFGSSSLTLANGGNNWSGGTTNLAGSLIVAANGALPGNVANLAAVSFAPTSAVTVSYSGSISGTGTIATAATTPQGIISFSGNNAASSASVGLGTLRLESGSALAVGTLTVGLNTTNSTNLVVPGASLTVGGSPTDELRVGYKTLETVNSEGYLDLTPLGSFTANVANVLVGNAPALVNSGNIGGNLTLASNSTINASVSVTVGDSAQAGNTVTPMLVFGQGTNVLNTPALWISGRKSSGAATIRSGGTLILSNAAGRANLIVGSNVVNTGTTPSGSADFSAGTFVATLDNFVVAARALGGNGTVTSTVVLGSSPLNYVDVNNVTLGSMNGGNAPAVANGTLTVSNGTVNVQTNVSLGSLVGPLGSAIGTLNLYGGSFNVAGDITGSASNASSSTIVLDGATLDLQPASDSAAGAIGTVDAPIKTLSLRSGTLRNVAQINTPATNLIKIGSGVLTLGNNAFSNGITVSNGTLNLAGIIDGNVLTIETNGTLAGNGTNSGAVTIRGTLSPGNGVGALTTGPQTWAPGGTYAFDVADAAASSGRDRLAVSGAVTIQATAVTPFSIRLASLNGAAPGLAANFNYDAAAAWSLASASGVTGFDPAAFTVDVSRFSNDLAGGTFAVTANLDLAFIPNHSPVLRATEGNLVSGTMTRNIADYLSKSASDVDGDGLALVTVFGGTNGTVTTNGSDIVYTSTNNQPDVFYCVVRDVRGSYRAGDTVRMATNTYTVTLGTNGPTPNITGQRLLPDGNVRISFATIPNRDYLVQVTDYLTNPIPWQTLFTTNSSTNGVLTVDDLQATNHAQRYYRTAAP